MKNLLLFSVLLFNSCNFLSSKVDMSEYMFSDVPRTWSVVHPEVTEVNQTISHEPFTKDGSRFVKVTTIFNGKKTIQTYQIKEETIDLIHHYKDGWGAKKYIADKPWPRYVSVGEPVEQHEHSGQLLKLKDDSTKIGEITLNHEIIEIYAPSSTVEDVYVYAKGIGLINRIQRFNVPSMTGKPVPNVETSIAIEGLDWIKCKDNTCEVAK